MRKNNSFKIDLEKCSFIAYGTKKTGFFITIKLLISNIGLHCILIYRYGQFAQKLYEKNKIIGYLFRFFYLFLNYLSYFIHKVDISSHSQIGSGFHISHAGNIFIGPSKIGNNCTLTHNVTIARESIASANEYPVIGNNVWIGTGSVIFGNIRIGDSVTISAGSIVSKNIPANCLIAGNPARIINNDYDNSKLLVYKMANQKESKNESDKKEYEMII